MEDEIASMGAIIGASLAGCKAMTATSGPGFSLKQENIGYAALNEIPCVVVNSQRVGPSTGCPTAPAQGDVMQARWGTHGDHPVVVLSPWSVQEAYHLTVKAFNIAEWLRLPVILLMDEVVGHMREPIVLMPPDQLEIVNRKKPAVSPGQFLPYAPVDDDIPPMATFGDGYYFHVTGLCHDETGFPTMQPLKVEQLLRRLCDKVEIRRPELCQVETQMAEDAEIVVLAYGATARSALSAVIQARELGIQAGLIRPVTLWPFSDQLLSLAPKAKVFVVAEMNLGQIVYEVERVVAGKVQVVPFNQVRGELIAPAEILKAIREVR
jgi:2-oxoglutarate ferredoxin oxidoreductase subunit alpha